MMAQMGGARLRRGITYVCLLVGVAACGGAPAATRPAATSNADGTVERQVSPVSVATSAEVVTPAPTTQPADLASASPADVMNQYVTAMRNLDRTAVSALTADMDFKASEVDANLRSMGEMLAPPDPNAQGATGGKLSKVMITKIVPVGQQQQGYSVWTFARRELCYRATMTQTAQGWRVLKWGVTTQACR